MNQRNFVAPLPTVERREPVNIGVDALMQGEVIHVGQPLAANHGAHEQTSGMDRSKAWVVRLIPYTVINLILSITLVELADGGWLLGFCLFAASSFFIYAWMDYREHKFSRNGLERHKVDTLADLKLTELEQNHELRKMVVVAQIEMWRGVQYDGSRTLTAGSGEVEGRATPQAKGYLPQRAARHASED